MLLPRLCSACDQQLTIASNAMRRHASQMSKALHLVQSASAAEVQRQDFRINLVVSFNEAQSAWDAYREHLIDHGFLPSPE
jgi:hypothetical protein